MFAHKSRTELTIRVFLITAFLLNALAPSAANAASVLSTSDVEESSGLSNTPGTKGSAFKMFTVFSRRAAFQDTTPVAPRGTATAMPSQTATSEVSATPTSDLRPTATLIGTPTPASTAVTPRPVADTPLLSLVAEPDYLIADSKLILDWVIEGVILEDRRTLALQITLPEELSLQAGYEGEYDETTRTLTISVTALSGEVTLLTAASVRDTKLSALLLDGSDVLTESILYLPVHEEYVVDERGGEITTDDGIIRIQFPADTFSERTVINVGPPSGDAIPEFSLMGLPFEITARDEETRTEVSRFSKELKISVSYADLGVPQELQGDLHLYWYNTETKEWEGLPSRADRETKTLIAYTDHFTVFDMDVNNWQASHLPTIDSFQVSTFTGAATYSLPIEVPPGPGGLQPSVSLNYNSQVVDQSTLNTQASWVGMGWSLETGSIELDTHGTPNWGDDDTLMLNVAGVSTRLVKDPSGVWHATDENFWKITYSAGAYIVKDKQGNTYTFSEIVNYPFEVDTCNDDWMTHRWLLKKVTNIFGQEINYTYTRQEKQIQFWDNCNWSSPWATTAIYPSMITYAGTPTSPRYAIWFDLENRLDYKGTWDTDTLYHSYEKSRLENIYVMQDSDANGTWDVTIRRYALSYAANGASDIIFPGYQWSAGGQTITLKSVKQYGTDNTTSLPPTTFTYGDNLHLTRADNGYGGQVEFDYEVWYYSPDARASYSVENIFGGYGHMPCGPGYDADPWAGRLYIGIVRCEDEEEDPSPLYIKGVAAVTTVFVDGGSIKNHSSSVYRNRSTDLIRPGGVYKLTAGMGLYGSGINVRAGLFNGTSETWGTNTGTAYILQLPANASKANPVIEVSGLVGTNYALLGTYKFQLLTSIHRVTVKRVKDGNGHTYPFTYSYLNGSGVDSAGVNDTVLSGTTCPPIPINGSPGCYGYFERFSEFRGHGRVTETGPDGKVTITEFYQGDYRKGRPSWIETRNGSLTLSKVLYLYTVEELPVALPSVAECSVCPPYIGVMRNFIYTDTVDNSVYNNNGTYIPTRTDYDYELTYGNLILEKEQSWNGSGWVTYRQKEHLFSFTNSATRYLVSLPYADRVLDPAGTILTTTLYFYDGSTGAPGTAPVDGKLTAIRTRIKQDGTQWSQVSYGYDNYGNRTSVTAYSGYSANNYTSPTTGARTTYTCYGGGGTLGGTACTNDGYYTYPLWTKDPLGHITYVSWGYGRSVPLSETDPNGNPTYAEYDTFARMTKLIRPGDSSTSPTVSMAYTDANPFLTEIRQRIENNGYVAIRRTYDGIGRQTKIEKGSSSLNTGNGTFSFTLSNTVTTLYPAFDTVQQSMPYASGGTAYYTTTESDVLGRPLNVTAPNGNEVSYAYNGLVTTVTDAKGYNTTSTSDIWGRVISVTPPTGPGVTYTYDLLNNLETATRGGVTTELVYDAAGRKTSMSDPDMGDWEYTYDALGNLTLQNDARGQRICLYYDALNRLLGKHYRTNNSCPTSPTYDVSYEYDSGTNGKLRRTGMDDASGSTSWLYDVRGRLVKETKNITGTSAFITEWDYNSADMLDWMKYPGADNEELTYTYNSIGLLDTITSNLGDTYVADTQYDAASRITTMDYGASIIRKTYNYYQWNVTDQGGLLNTATTVKLSNQTTLQSFAYTYDENANVSTIVDNQAGPQTQTFGYDSLNRLTSAAAAGGSNGLYTETYEYKSDTGNLWKKAGVTYSYNDPDHAHAVTNLTNGNNYAYDENGNMTDRNVGALTFDLAYDAENRLVSVTGNGTAPTSTPAPTNTPTRTPTPGGPTATFTPTPTATNTPGGPTATYTPSPTAGSDLIFADGFESGNLSTWTSSTTDSGDLSASTTSAMKGTYGMQAVLDDINTIYTTDDSPNAEPRYRARFYFDPNSITMASGDAHYIFKGFNGASTDVFQMEFRYSSGNYELRVRVLNDASSWTNSNWFVISDASHYIEVDWRAATSSGANNGYLTLWIDGTQQADLTSVDNDTWSVDRARLGALSGLDSGTNGTYYFDAFESRRSSYIGPMAMGGGHFASYRLAPLQQGSTYSEQPDGTDGIDTYLLNTSPTTNNGTTVTMWIGESNNATDKVARSLIKFDLSSIPSNATITSATLSIWTDADFSDNDRTIRVYRLKVPFSESQATWNEASSGVNWASPGASGTADREGTDIGFVLIPENQALDVEKQISLSTTQIQQMVSGAFTNNGFIIIADNEEDDRFSYRTSDASAATKRPKLVIEYTTSSATNTPTNTPTPGPSPTATRTPTPGASPTPTATQPPQGAFNSATFVYDGDGKRVKSTFNGTTTTYFVGNHYEVTGSTITKYYYAGAQRIAMRTNGTLNYLLGDHLGSTSLTTNSSGQVVSELRYKAWGETRYASGTTPTKYQYTGQYSYVNDFGLHFYNARWYDSSLGRFAQADSIVPRGIQGLDRYAYVNNSPLNYVDPSGHTAACTRDRWDDGPQCFGKTRQERLTRLGITIDDDMPDTYISAIIAAAIDDGGFWAVSMGIGAENAFSKKHGGITIAYDPNCSGCRSQDAQNACGGRTSGSVRGINCTPGGAVTDNAHHITVASMSQHADARVFNMVHEFGHTFNNLNDKGPEIELGHEHYELIGNRSLILRPNPGYLLYQQNTDQTATETFADLYVAQVYNAWNSDPQNAGWVDDAKIWINTWMP